MFTVLKSLAITASIFLTIAHLGCSDEKPTEPKNNNQNNFKNITHSGLVQEVTQDISELGGTIAISNSSSIMNGLSIQISPESHENNRTYTISSAEIQKHELGENFNPISPLINIKNGGGYAKKPIIITVPITLNKGEFAMGFLYNEITGKIEPLPIIDLTDDYITVETRHFSLSSIVAEKSFSKAIDITSSGNLIISSIKESKMLSQAVISSGFTPGVDDWEFINYGSYIAPGGHCAGQSISAMWYYYEKKIRGEPSLFHKYDFVNKSDNPGLLWQDNPFGYRLASTIQVDADWGQYDDDEFWERETRFRSNFPTITWKSFIASIFITGEPQLVIVRSSSNRSAHAMIIYKVNITEGKLYVADPNYPNNRTLEGNVSVRTISYAENKFEPYPSFAKAGGSGVLFDQIVYFAKTAHFDWGKIGERFTELENGVIGNDRFPSYKLLIKSEGQMVPMIDGMTVIEDSMIFYCENENIPLALPGTFNKQEIWVFDRSGEFRGRTDNRGIVRINVNPGQFKVGSYIRSIKDHFGDVGYYFYDFKWTTLTIEKPNQNYPLLQKNRAAFKLRVNTEVTRTNDEGTVEYEQLLEIPGSIAFMGGFSENTFVGAINVGTITDTLFGSLTATINTSRDLLSNVDFKFTTKSKDMTFYNNLKSSTQAINIPFFEDEDGKITFKITGISTCENLSYLEDNFETWYLNEARSVTGYSCDENSFIEVSFYRE